MKICMSEELKPGEYFKKKWQIRLANKGEIVASFGMSKVIVTSERALAVLDVKTLEHYVITHYMKSRPWAILGIPQNRIVVLYDHGYVAIYDA